MIPGTTMLLFFWLKKTKWGCVHLGRGNALVKFFMQAASPSHSDLSFSLDREE
jgi:hypothetical protein